MPATTYVNVNGRRLSHASGRIRFFGLHVRGLKSITYKHSVDRGDARGTSRQSGGMTVGEYKAECSAEMYRSDFEELMDRMSKIDPTAGRFDVAGEITVSKTERNQPTITDTIKVFGMKEEEQGSQQGSDADMVKVAFDVHGIKMNGKLPFPDFEW